jgi:hypothetical protein
MCETVKRFCWCVREEYNARRPMEAARTQSSEDIFTLNSRDLLQFTVRGMVMGMGHDALSYSA